MKFQDIKPCVGLDFIKLYTNSDGVKTKEDALGYIGDIISKLLSVLDTYRSEMLLFNAENEEEKIAYEFIFKIPINHKGINIDLFLFNI